MLVPMKKGAFQNNVVIITGASSGIGMELAYLLASEGAWLSLAARRREKLDEVAAKCRRLGGRALVVPTDVSDETRCKRLIDATIAEYGRIDTLVNNAGYGLSARLADLPDLSQFREMIDVNLLGSVYCTYYALHFIKETRGRIAGVSSVLGKFGTPGNTAYAASKFGMAGFFDSLRVELKRDGVGVTCIFPGLTITEFAEHVRKPDGSIIGEKGKRIYGPKTMTAAHAARIIRDVVAHRKPEVVLTKEGKFAVWMKKFMPGVLDKIILRVYAGREKKRGR